VARGEGVADAHERGHGQHADEDGGGQVLAVEQVGETIAAARDRPHAVERRRLHLLVARPEAERHLPHVER
jgi:hypothetical protein